MITMTQRAISERDVYKDLRLSDIDKKLKKKTTTFFGNRKRNQDDEWDTST